MPALLTKCPALHYLQLTALIVVFSCCICQTATASSYKKTYYGTEIPTLIKTDSKTIFENSDSLYLNGRLLMRGTDYSYNRDSLTFDLSALTWDADDSLVVSYRTAPRWLNSSFGLPIPEIATQVNAIAPFQVPASPNRLQPTKISDINISGAKTFRFSSQTAGNSEFGQSLDLNVDGNLSDDLKLSGSISDRGYNPSYGTANSRIEELDKVNLRLESKTFTAQVGDIQLGRQFGHSNFQHKKISGAAVNVSGGNLGLNGVIARPKGRFSTFRFVGSDGVQGPYQIGEGSQARAVVPNSETVWLDGRRLQVGSDNDYVMDYPSGRITFSVKNLIDRRSRIEIDYEPVSAEYKTELISAGTSYRIGDSSFYAIVDWYREGDDKSQPQNAELSPGDIQILQSAGDSVYFAVKSGVRPDSGGSYEFDSTYFPDTVLVYVGDGNGSYTAAFSYVGANQGEYKFAGGNHYIYSGANGGDYQPLIKIPAPERTDLYNTEFGINSAILGSVNALVSLSQNDKNLYSTQHDNDNRGLLLNLNSRKELTIGGRPGSMELRWRTKESTYFSNNRLDLADFNRIYLVPQNFSKTTNEALYEGKAEVTPIKNVTLLPSAGRLEYKNSFAADKFSLNTALGQKTGLNGRISWGTVKSNLRLSTDRTGRVNTIGVGVSAPVFAQSRLSAEYENDSRKNNYNVIDEGLRYQRFLASVERHNERLTYEFYTEDSLSSDWSQFSTRNRLTASSVRRFGNFSYNSYLGYQWLSRLSSKEESFLSRADLRYHNNRRQLNLEVSYALSDETRNARGITYLEVDPGQGNYIFENGRYLPDPDGNFIQVEELLSERSRVNRGDKSFLFSKNWTGVQIRFNSKIEEELLENGSRGFLWLVPFFSDDSQPYLVYNRQYNSELRLLPIRGGHAVNISLDERTENRNLSGSPRIRRDRNGSLLLKQTSGQYYFEEKLKVFVSDRDNYFIGAGEIDGYQIAGAIRRLINSNEYSLGGGYRRAQSAINEISQITGITGEARIRVIEKGELRNSLEFYHQTLQNVNGTPSYLLTDNKSGRNGIIWTSAFNYHVRQGLRINFRMSGRHSDESTARITGRGEVVAEF